MGKELVNVKVVIEQHGTQEVLAQRSMSVTAKLLDPEHRDFAKEINDTVGLRVQQLFGEAYLEACPAPDRGGSDTPTES